MVLSTLRDLFQFTEEDAINNVNACRGSVTSSHMNGDLFSVIMNSIITKYDSNNENIAP